MQVAARCKGEASFAIALCACVVKNRLAGGYSEANVLDAFYAADVTPTATEIWLADRVLVGYWPCDPRLWYMFSSHDCWRLALDPGKALLVVTRESWQVLFYGKDAL